MRTISVTQEHIDRGVCEEPKQCAVALSMTDSFGLEPPVFVSVGSRYVFVGDDTSKSGKSPLPSHVERWIEQFDEGDDVEPIEFEFDDTEFNRFLAERGAA